MDTKFYSSLFEGDSVMGARLSMGLTGGDFWARVSGCRNVYRGDADGGAEGIDFSRVLAVSDIESTDVTVSGIVHEASESYLYAVRLANRAGVEEKSFGGVVRVSFDGSEELEGDFCNGILDLSVVRMSGRRVKIRWQYSAAGQKAACDKFFVYSNAGSGRVDFTEPIGTVKYARAGEYAFESAPLVAGRWYFCVGAETAEGKERLSSLAGIDITDAETGGIDSAKAGVL